MAAYQSLAMLAIPMSCIILLISDTKSARYGAGASQLPTLRLEYCRKGYETSKWGPHERRKMIRRDEIKFFQSALERGVFANAAKILLNRDDLKGKVVIDLACGDGRTTYLLRQKGAVVFPYDILPDHYKLEDRPVVADVNHALPIASQSADLVILQEVIEHLPNQLLALKEIYRILKPGGELFLTTPSRSSLSARLAYLVFESENLKATPWGFVDGTWGHDKESDSTYYGHLFLIGLQQLRALGGIAGFKSIEVKRTQLSKSSLALMLFFYPFILLLSGRALSRDLKKHKEDAAYHARYVEEKWTQFKLNVDPWNLINRYFIAVLKK